MAELSNNETHFNEIESLRKRVLKQYGSAVFLIGLREFDIPPMNPVDFYFAWYRRFSRRNRKLTGFVPLICITALMVFFTYLYYSGGFASNSKLSTSELVELIVGQFSIIYIPIGVWFYHISRRIQLIFFGDYVKRRIVKALTLMQTYYQTLLDSGSIPEEKGKSALAQVRQSVELVQKPHLLRNLTLGGLSTAVGVIGVVQSLVTSHSLSSEVISFVGNSTQSANFGEWFSLLFVLPFYFVMGVVIFPIFIGTRKAVYYCRSNFGPVESEMRNSVILHIKEISETGENLTDQIPLGS